MAEDTAFTVRVLNETLGIGEKIARIGNVEGTSFFRNASLSITPQELALSCTDDVGSTHALGAIPQQDLKLIRLKKSAFTPGQQLIKPAMTGLFSGIVLNAVIWFRVGERRVIGLDQAIGMGILVVLGMIVLFVVINLGKIVWSKLAVVAFEGADGKSVEVAIEDEKVDDLLALFRDRNVPVEPI